MARLINNTHLFIHTAKTGGTFFRETINLFGIPNKEVLLKHSSYEDVMKNNSSTFVADAKAFGFIRNPIQWYRSRWSYGMMTYFGEKIKYMPEAQRHWMAPIWSNNLNEFVDNTLQLYPEGIAYKYFNSMLSIKENKTIVLKYENIHIELAWILNELGVKNIKASDLKTLPRVLPSKQFNSDISPELVKEIIKVEHKLMNYYE